MSSYSELATRLLQFGGRHLGSGVLDDEINVEERNLGIRIEGGYREFLKQFGWGGVGHLELYGLGGPPPLDLGRVTQSERLEMEPHLPTHLLPVMNNGGGDLYCLDTSVTNEPPVVFWDHEGGANQVPKVVAESFSSWLWAKLGDLEQA